MGFSTGRTVEWIETGVWPTRCKTLASFSTGRTVKWIETGTLYTVRDVDRVSPRVEPWSGLNRRIASQYDNAAHAPRIQKLCSALGLAVCTPPLTADGYPLTAPR